MDSGEPQERTDAWAEIVCGDAEVQTITRAELAAESESGDVVARGICERDVITGTLTQKQQILSLYSSDNAMETYLSGIDCDSDPLRVNGDDWVARTYVEELAPDMVEAGAELSC